MCHRPHAAWRLRFSRQRPGHNQPFAPHISLPESGHPELIPVHAILRSSNRGNVASPPHTPTCTPNLDVLKWRRKRRRKLSIDARETTRRPESRS